MQQYGRGLSDFYLFIYSEGVASTDFMDGAWLRRGLKTVGVALGDFSSRGVAFLQRRIALS